MAKPKTKKEDFNVVVVIRLPESVKDEFEAVCDKSHMSMSAQGRVLICEFIERSKIKKVI